MAPFIRRWLVAAEPPPDPFPEDEVIPGFVLDDMLINRELILIWTLRFNDVLDGDKLHDALARLLAMGNWRKLGGRLKLNSKGKMEIHIPPKFTPSRPAVRYTRATFDTKLREHPLASRLPRPDPIRPSAHPAGSEFRTLAVPPDAPATFADYVVGDTPQLGLHVVSFEDATLVTLAFPHTTTDALGLSALVRAWCAVLAGREGEVAPLRGFREDPVEEVVKIAEAKVDEAAEPFIHKDKYLAGWAMFVFVVRFLFEIFFKSRQKDGIIILPRHSVEALKKQAQADIADIKGSSDAFISEGDVLNAWGLKLDVLALSPHSTRPVTAANPVEMRSRVASVFDPRAAYVQNLLTMSYTLLTVREIWRAPLGVLALRHRAALTAQTSERQMAALARDGAASAARTGQPLAVGEAGCMIAGFSNWSKARFFEVADFAPAVVRAWGAEGREGMAGRPVGLQIGSLGYSPVIRNVFNIMGTDAEGNCWITAVLPPAAWPKVEEELRKI